MPSKKKLKSVKKMAKKMMDNFCEFKTVDKQNVVGDFSKFAFPLIRSVFPRLMGGSVPEHNPPDQEIFRESIECILNGLECVKKYEFGKTGVTIVGANDVVMEIATKEDGSYWGKDRQFLPTNPNFISEVSEYINGRCTSDKPDSDNGIVDVQPMVQPRSSIFFLDFNKGKDE